MNAAGIGMANHIQGHGRHQVTLLPDALDIGGQPLPLIKKIIKLFGETKTPWALAVWFCTANGWLGNKKPKDLLVSAPEKVMEAALRAKEGPVHG